MTKNSGNAPVNTQAQAVENAEQTKKSQSRNLVREFVSPFVETRLSEKDGGEFYTHAKTSKWDIKSDFLAYWKAKEEWNNLSKEEKATLEGVDNLLFLKEVVRIGAGMESKRDTLGKVLDREFSLTSAQKQNIDSEIKTFSLSDLTKYLNYATSRKELIARVFPKKETQPQEHDLGKQLESLLAKNHVVLDEKQKENISRLLISSHISEQDVEGVLSLFTKLEEKQLLIKYFLPTITLAELEEMGILSKSQVHAYIRKCVESQIIGKDFTIEDELIESVDPSDIVLPTNLLPETDLDVLLAGKWKKAIIKQIESANQEMEREFEEGNTLGLTPNEDGKLLPDFQEKLRGLGIPNPENFTEGSYVRGKIKQPDGTFQLFHFAITGIDDDLVKNRQNKGVGKQIMVKNILTSDGSVNKNWNKKEGELHNYSDIFALLEKAVKGKKWFPEITTQEMLEAQVESGDVKEKILREDIGSLGALNDALDTVDTDGKKYPLQKGSSLQVGKPGSDGFWVFQVKSINEASQTIALSDGNSQEILSFQDFFDNFESREGARLPKMEGPEDFLKAIQMHSPKSKDFEGIIFDKNRGVFVPEDRKDDKNFPGILQFGGEKETITLHSKDAGGLAGWTTGEWVEWIKEDKEKKIKATPGKYKAGANGYKAGWNALYAQFLALRVTPKIPDIPLTPPEQKNAQMSEKHGYLKHYMGNPSLHDMFTGAKSLVDFVKHKLEHGSKLHAAKFQLALGKKLGFNDAMMRELRNQVHGGTRELMEKMVKELSSLPSAERQTEVKHILENKGSHDYEIQAAILSMLKKHGNLYVGSLKSLEGSFAYFERLSGTKYGPNNEHVQRALKACKEKGILFREEFLIENYLQHVGGEKGGYQVDWNLWLEVKKSWPEGMKAEGESGENAAAAFGTLDGRLNWVYEKFAWGEYSNGIGAMKKVWSKWGSPHKMHEPAMYLALSNISTRLHGSQLDALKNEFYAGGHPYPALTALFTPEKLATFQKTVKILSEGNPDMKLAYEKIENERNKDVGKAMEAIRSFWGTYGPDIHKKLLISQDPEILYRAQHDANPETREVLSSYVKNYKGDTENMGEFNKDELGEGVYGYHHSGYVWSTDMYLKNARVDRGPGTIGDDKGTVTMWEGYLKALDDVKKIKVTDDEKKNEIFQQERFKEYHKAFYKTILQKVGADWADIDKETGMKKIEKQTYMTDLKARWFSVPPWRDVSKLETPEYDHIVQRDFDDYMSGSKKKTTRDETETVATSISDLLTR